MSVYIVTVSCRPATLSPHGPNENFSSEFMRTKHISPNCFLLLCRILVVAPAFNLNIWKAKADISLCLLEASLVYIQCSRPATVTACLKIKTSPPKRHHYTARSFSLPKLSKPSTTLSNPTISTSDSKVKLRGLSHLSEVTEISLSEICRPSSITANTLGFIRRRRKRERTEWDFHTQPKLYWTLCMRHTTTVWQTFTKSDMGYQYATIKERRDQVGHIE